MRINTNISALNAHRQLGINQSGVAKSTERLSSGFRINRAGDDAAGLAISEKMRAQVRGLKQA
ncbi:MAG: flagellin protein, partial [Desulfotomaculaceae bacterium]